MSDDPKQDAHNDGEKDAVEHWRGEGSDSWDPLRSKYDPPEDPDLKDSYDKGWKNSEEQIFG